MGLIVEKRDDERGVLLVKHYEDDDRSFSKLPVRKLRASGVGRDCDTELFLTAAGQESQFDKKSLRIFEIGRVMEPVIVKWMRWEVKHNADDEYGMIMRVRHSHAHYDVIADTPKITKGEWRFDIKTMNTQVQRMDQNGVH